MRTPARELFDMGKRKLGVTFCGRIAVRLHNQLAIRLFDEVRDNCESLSRGIQHQLEEQTL